jgi:hypothetical protein
MLMHDDIPLIKEVVFPDPAPATIVKLRGGVSLKHEVTWISASVSGFLDRVLMIL